VDIVKLLAPVYELVAAAFQKGIILLNSLRSSHQKLILRMYSVVIAGDADAEKSFGF
jgi:hypothetical protein